MLRCIRGPAVVPLLFLSLGGRRTDAPSTRAAGPAVEETRDLAPAAFWNDATIYFLLRIAS